MPMNVEARDAVYATAKEGKVRLHEMLEDGKPMACRELSLLGHAILADYGIPSKYLKGELYIGAQDFWGSKLANKSGTHAVTKVVDLERSGNSQPICYLDATKAEIIFKEDRHSIGNKIPIPTEEQKKEKDEWFRLNDSEYHKWEKLLNSKSVDIKQLLETAAQENRAEFISLRKESEVEKRSVL
jgi:hypothetical protein